MKKNITISVRVTDDVKAQLEQAADASGRSLNAEIFSRLRRSLEPQVDMETVVTMVQENGAVARTALSGVEQLDGQFNELKSTTVVMLEKFLNGEIKRTDD